MMWWRSCECRRSRSTWCAGKPGTMILSTERSCMSSLPWLGRHTGNCRSWERSNMGWHYVNYLERLTSTSCSSRPLRAGTARRHNGLGMSSRELTSTSSSTMSVRYASQLNGGRAQCRRTLPQARWPRAIIRRRRRICTTISISGCWRARGWSHMQAVRSVGNCSW